ncbi:DNA-nicking Smr family endonuclease [Lysobacter niabensis]|uniref:DNA-nicking Smr family endonuclease n=1 Tax=Agrilutibacter niabensis TaxID=380628 RepID=A0ABU1VQ42_9GAMM|nr:Smr/MutS family protein [Lysobacter niabensis]MDR7099455.1 DNA-nicking Smr family endonuclease [Lysobacter niabensis]
MTSDQDDDADLFRSAVGPVRKLRDVTPPPASRPKPKPRARMAERDEAAARDEFRHALDATLVESGDVLSYRRDVLPPRVLQRLRRGEIAVQDEVDLHGADTREAEALLRAFLAHARDHDAACVRIIHGKGLHGGGPGPFSSRDVPVLKNLVDRLLRQRADVLGFHSAPPTQGGTGAVLVLLAPRRSGSA